MFEIDVANECYYISLDKSDASVRSWQQLGGLTFWIVLFV